MTWPLEITMNTAHIETADEAARKRLAYAEAHNRVPVNGGPRAYWMETLGTRTELAGKLFLNPIEWHDFKEGPPDGTPDLGDFIDVKGIGKRGRRLVVQIDAEPEWAYFLIGAYRHPTYELLGWLWGYEAKAEPVSDPHGGRPAHFVNRALRAPELLFAEVRWREGIGVWSRKGHRRQ